MQDLRQRLGFQLFAIFNCSFPERLTYTLKPASSWEFRKLVPVRRMALVVLVAVIFRRAEGNGHRPLGSGHVSRLVFAGPWRSPASRPSTHRPAPTSPRCLEQGLGGGSPQGSSTARKGEGDVWAARFYGCLFLGLFGLLSSLRFKLCRKEDQKQRM